jgi:acylphosphatase
VTDQSQIQLHAIISGRVQGVGFRYFVLEKAQLQGLTGWVRNLWDGRVEVVAEGERQELERFLAVLKRGPSSAWVSAIAEMWNAPSGEFGGFHVRQTG